MHNNADDRNTGQGRRGWLLASMRIVRFSAWALLFALPTLAVVVEVALAQDPARRVGILLPFDPSKGRGYQSFLDGMRQLGWVEDKTVKYFVRHAGGDPDRLPALCKELVSLAVEVIYAWDSVLPACRNLITQIPMVSSDMYDPVAEGLTSSLKRPSRNITGISWQTVEGAPKRLELTKELVPGLKRVGFLYDVDEPAAALELEALIAASRSAGMVLTPYAARDLQDIRAAFTALKSNRVGALIVGYHPLTSALRHEIAQLAADIKLPTVGEGRRFADGGLLMTYGTDVVAADERAAAFVDKLLHGAKPADLPIELAPRFDLVINLKTAERIGITIPSSIQVRATDVIRAR